MCVFLCLCPSSQEECENFCTIRPDSVHVAHVRLLVINPLSLPGYVTSVLGCLCAAPRRVSETDAFLPKPEHEIIK